ncbi:ATP-dependent RecD-like DNA helicase, partial [Mesorhizobium sp. M8A.F.Ca.ET.173.01.1.1]
LEMTQEMLSQPPNEVIEHQQLENMIQVLVEDTNLVKQESEIAIPSLYYSELKSVQNLYRNYTYTNKLKEIEQSELQLEIGEIEQRNQVTYANS